MAGFPALANRRAACSSCGMNAAAGPKESNWRIWVGFFGVCAPSSAGIGLTPLMTTAAMAARDLNEAQIGLAFSFDLLANALVTIWVSQRLSKFSPQVLGIVGATLMIAGNALGMYGEEYWPLVLGFAMRGAGIGCLLNAQSALAARVASPQRLVGASMAIQMAMIIAAPVLSGRLIETHGQIGVFGIYAAAAAIALPLIVFAPGVRKDAPPSTIAPSFAGVLALIRSPFVIAGILAYMGLNAMWPFFAQVAGERGLEPSQAGDLIAIVTVGAGIIGISSAILPDRLVAPVALIAVAACAIGSGLLPMAPTVPLMIAAFAVMATSFTFMQNLFMTIGVRLDRTGGLNAGSGGVNSLISSSTPTLAGMLIHATGSYASLAIFSLVALVGGVTMLRIAVRDLDRAPLTQA